MDSRKRRCTAKKRRKIILDIEETLQRQAVYLALKTLSKIEPITLDEKSSLFLCSLPFKKDRFGRNLVIFVSIKGKSKNESRLKKKCINWLRLFPQSVVVGIDWSMETARVYRYDVKLSDLKCDLDTVIRQINGIPD